MIDDDKQSKTRTADEVVHPKHVDMCTTNRRQTGDKQTQDTHTHRAIISRKLFRLRMRAKVQRAIPPRGCLFLLHCGAIFRFIRR